MEQWGNKPTGSGPVPGAPQRPLSQSEPPFVGRERHLAILRDAFEVARRGRPVAVYVQGESGMGKSALVARFLDLVNARGDALVFGGRCYEHESIPYKGVDEVVEALSRYLEQIPARTALQLVPYDAAQLARLFPALAWLDKLPPGVRPRAETPNPREGRRRAFSALRELLARVAEVEPVVIAIDDMQWADIDTAALIAELMRGSETPRLMLVLAYRAGDRTTSEPLKVLLGESSPIALEHALFSSDARPVDVRLVDVDPLTSDAATQLARSLLGISGPGGSAQAALIASEAAGNPLFVRELARHVNERGQVGAAGIDSVVQERIRRLPAGARHLLEVTAVASSPIAQRVGLAAAGLDAHDHGTLAVLIGEHLVRTRGRAESPRIEPYHDRIRAATVAAMSPDRVEQCHRELAAAYEAAGGTRAETMARHLQRAGDAVAASRYASTAATDAAAVLAFDRAAALHRLFLDMAPDDDPRRPELEVKLGDALANAGRGAAAAEAYLAAASRPAMTEAQAHELCRRAAGEYIRCGHIDEGLIVLDEVLAHIGVKLPRRRTPKLIRFLLGRARLRLRGLSFTERNVDEIPRQLLTRVDTLHAAVGGVGMVDPVDAMLLHEHHLRSALAAGESHRIARALAYELGAVSFAGVRSTRRVAELSALARALTRHVGNNLYAMAHIETAEGVAAHNVGRWTASRDHCARALELLRQCSAVSWETATAQYYLLWSLFQLGELTEHARLAPTWLHEAQERDDLYSEVAMRMTLGYTYLIHDDPEAARREVTRGFERWSHQGFHVPHIWSWMLNSLIDLYLGDGRAAWEGMSSRWDSYQRSLFPRLQQPHLQVLVLQGWCALGAATESRDPAELRRLLRVADRNAREVRRIKAPWALPFSPGLRASVAALRGDTAGALRLLETAAAGFDRAQMPMYAACLRRRAGQLTGGDAGKRLAAAAEQQMTAHGVHNPACFTDAVAPGFFRR